MHTTFSFRTSETTRVKAGHPSGVSSAAALARLPLVARNVRAAQCMLIPLPSVTLYGSTALKAGLVEDDAPYIKSTRQWGNRYEQQNANNAYDIDDIPEEDEYGNPIERAIIKHGRGPAQPSAGFGDRGNETMGLEADRRQDDLLSGLPDEDRDRRKREKKNRVQEYGAGYDDDYEREQERRNGGGGGGGRSNGLIDDLQDPDYAPRPIRNGGSSNFGSNNPYGGGGGGGSSRGTSAPSRSRSNGGDGLVGDLEDPDALYGSRRNGEQSIMQKRSMGGSGKQKKSDRYGLSSDHQDLGAAPSKSSSSSGKAGKKQKSMDSYSQGGDRGSYGNDRYDGYDVREESRGGSSRRQASKSGGGDDDFLNHQF